MTNDNALFGFTGPFGVSVSIKQSLLMLVLVLFAFIGVMDGNVGFVALLLVFLIVSIYLHELGHALGAKSQGVAVRQIVLHGGGGFCAHGPAGPKESLVLIASGPLVNLTLWLAAQPISEAVLAFGGEAAQVAEIARYILFFGTINLWLFIFNMIPVLPLDGGRLFYLALWWRLPQATASRITGLVGLIISILWIPAAFAAFYFLGFILFFFPSIRDNWRRFKGET